MPKALNKEIIHIPAFGFARPRPWIVESVTNGLALCVNRENKQPTWQCVHMPTGKPVIPRALRGGAKRKDVAAFIAALAPKFPWTRWKVAANTPGWGDKAFNAVNMWRV